MRANTGNITPSDLYGQTRFRSVIIYPNITDFFRPPVGIYISRKKFRYTNFYTLPTTCPLFFEPLQRNENELITQPNSQQLLVKADECSALRTKRGSNKRDRELGRNWYILWIDLAAINGNSVEFRVHQR